MTDAREPAAPLPIDTHKAQAERIASHCERHPGRFFTAAELDAACDLGSRTKVLSAMSAHDGLGYGLEKGWRHVACDNGSRLRQVRTYRVTHRPRCEQRSLPFEPG